MKDEDLDRKEFVDREMRERGDMAKYQTDFLTAISQESEPALQKLTKEAYDNLFSRKKILMTADLNIDNIRDIFKWVVMDRLFYQEYANPKFKPEKECFKGVRDDLLSMSVSKNRKGRGEGVEIARSFRESAKEEMMKKELG